MRAEFVQHVDASKVHAVLEQELPETTNCILGALAGIIAGTGYFSVLFACSWVASVIPCSPCLEARCWAPL